MRTYDLTPFYRSTVGFDRLFSLLDRAVPEASPGYPPYNIERTGDNSYRISVAVSGFAQDELSIVAKENTLTIKGEKTATEASPGLVARAARIAGAAGARGGERSAGPEQPSRPEERESAPVVAGAPPEGTDHNVVDRVRAPGRAWCLDGRVATGGRRCRGDGRAIPGRGRGRDASPEAAAEDRDGEQREREPAGAVPPSRGLRHDLSRELPASLPRGAAGSAAAYPGLPHGAAEPTCRRLEPSRARRPPPVAPDHPRGGPTSGRLRRRGPVAQR